MDTSAWRILAGERAALAGTASATVSGSGMRKPHFHRLQAPVIFFRAVAIDDSLFNFHARDDFGHGLFTHGFTWAHCVDNLEIVECAGNHFTLLMPSSIGGDHGIGDLDTAVLPVMCEWLRRYWEADAPVVAPTATALPAAAAAPAESVEPPQRAAQAAAAASGSADGAAVARTSASASWTQAWWGSADGPELPAWFAPHVTPGDAGSGLPDLDLHAGSVVLGLNHLAVRATFIPPPRIALVLRRADAASPPAQTGVAAESATWVVLVGDLLEAAERWSAVAARTQLPVLGVHVPPAVAAKSREQRDVALGDSGAGYAAALRAVLPAGAACLLASDAEIGTGALATDVALHLRATGWNALAVLLLPPDADLPRRARARQDPAQPRPGAYPNTPLPRTVARRLRRSRRWRTKRSSPRLLWQCSATWRRSGAHSWTR